MAPVNTQLRAMSPGVKSRQSPCLTLTVPTTSRGVAGTETALLAGVPGDIGLPDAGDAGDGACVLAVAPPEAPALAVVGTCSSGPDPQAEVRENASSSTAYARLSCR